MNMSNHNSFSSYEGGDIRDLIRSKGPPLIPKLPKKNRGSYSSRSKSKSSRREGKDPPEIKRKNSQDRAMHKRTIDSHSSEDEPIVSDTNSTTDTENEKTSEGKSNSTPLSIDQLKDEYNNLNRHGLDTRRGGLREAIRRRSESIANKRRSRSMAREPPVARRSSVSSVPKTEGKGLFVDRLSQSLRGAAENFSDKEEKPRKRGPSKSRFRSKSRARTRSKSRTPKTESRSRSKSRTPNDKSRDRSESRTPKGRSRSRAPKDRTRDRSESRKPKERSRDRSESRKPKDRNRSVSRKPKDRSRARSKSRARSPSRDRGKSVKSKKGKDKRRPSIKKRDPSVGKQKLGKEFDIPKDSDAPSETSLSLPSRHQVEKTTDTGIAIHSVSMDGSIDSMVIRKTNSLDSSLARKNSVDSASSKKSMGWYKPTAASSMEDSPFPTRESPMKMKRPPLSPRFPPADREVARSNSDSSNSRNSGKNGSKLPKRDWKASIKSMFKPPPLAEKPIEKAASKPEVPAKQWQADLTNLDGDETVATFERLWDKEQAASVRSFEDDTMKSVENPVSASALSIITENQNGSLQGETQMQGFKDEVTSLKIALEAKKADLVVVRAQLDTSIMESERQRSEAQDALQELKDQVTHLREALSDRESKITSLQKQLDLAYSENNQEMYKAEVQLKDFREKMSSIDESLEQKDNEIKKLSDELERANLKLSTEMGQENGATDNQLKEFREQVTTLQDMVGEKIKVVAEMQAKLDEAESENKIMLEELDDLLKEKNSAEEKAAKAISGGNEQNDAIDRIKDLEVELENATKVANLQLEELDEQVDGLKDKLKAEREESNSKIKSRDATIDELTSKLRKYEAVPSTTTHSFGFSKGTVPSSADSVGSGKSGKSGKSGRASAATTFALPDIAKETPVISTNDVTDIESAKQKVYEARADATSVRESLEISTKKCAELTLANETLSKKNATLVDTRWERDDLKDKVRDWTAQTYNWKRRAEDAESKLSKLQGNSSGADDSNADGQGNMIAAAMDRSGGNENSGEKKSGWSLFGRNNNSNHNPPNRVDTKSSDGESVSEAKDAQIAGLNEVIAKLRSELVQMQSAHKEEVYLTKKRITQLEGENEALKVQNETLEQLSRFHSDH